jgi:hypothetical protein
MAVLLRASHWREDESVRGRSFSQVMQNGPYEIRGRHSDRTGGPRRVKATPSIVLQASNPAIFDEWRLRL